MTAWQSGGRLGKLWHWHGDHWREGSCVVLLLTKGWHRMRGRMRGMRMDQTTSCGVRVLLSTSRHSMKRPLQPLQHIRLIPGCETRGIFFACGAGGFLYAQEPDGLYVDPCLHCERQPSQWGKGRLCESNRCGFRARAQCAWCSRLLLDTNTGSSVPDRIWGAQRFPHNSGCKGKRSKERGEKC